MAKREESVSTMYGSTIPDSQEGGRSDDSPFLPERQLDPTVQSVPVHGDESLHYICLSSGGGEDHLDSRETKISSIAESDQVEGSSDRVDLLAEEQSAESRPSDPHSDRLRSVARSFILFRHLVDEVYDQMRAHFDSITELKQSVDDAVADLKRRYPDFACL